MTELFVFTAGNKEAREHLDDSVRSPFPLTLISNYLSESELALVRKVEESVGALYAWGATPGPNNLKTWQAMSPGDYVLVVFDARYRYYSRVVEKIHNPDAAKAIWQTDSSGNTWEYMYFMSKPVPVNVHLSLISGENLLHKRYMGFVKISEERRLAIEELFGSLDGLTNWLEAGEHSLPRKVDAAEEQINQISKSEESKGTYTAKGPIEAREKALREIAIRRGQPEFRAQLLSAYGSRCAFTGADCEEALEAAHILPYSMGGTNMLDNGLLLRADIHTLFDMGLIGVDIRSMTITLSSQLTGSYYGNLSGKKILLPSNESKKPSRIFLAAHALHFCLPGYDSDREFGDLSRKQIVQLYQGSE